jgi:hypothetical protein
MVSAGWQGHDSDTPLSSGWVGCMCMMFVHASHHPSTALVGAFNLAQVVL